MKMMKRALACALAVLLILPSASTKAAELPANEGRENISAETEMLPAEETISEEKETEQLAGDVAEGEKESPEESKETEAEEANWEEAEAEDSEVKEDSDTQQEETVPENTEETTAEASEDTEKEAASAEESEKADSDKPEEVLPEESEKNEKTDEVLYNTGNHVWSVVNREAFEEEGTGDACFEEDGSYTIHIPETNPFFPYEVQFTHDGEVTNEWFMTPDDSVEIGGHTFYVSASFDGTALTQMSLEISGDTIVVYPEEKEFTDDESGSVSPLSLIPLKHVELGTIDLSEYTPVELTRVQLEAIVKAGGEDVSGTKTVVWQKKSYSNTSDYMINKTTDFVDLSDGVGYGSQTAYEMFVGDGDQLNPDNVYYTFTIQTPKMEEWITSLLYAEDTSGGRSQVPVGVSRFLTNDYDVTDGCVQIMQTEVFYDGIRDKDVYAGLVLDNDRYQKTNVAEIKVMSGTTEITEKILSPDMTQTGAGYLTGIGENTNLGLNLTLDAYDASGNIIGSMPVYWSSYSPSWRLSGTLYKKDNSSSAYMDSCSIYESDKEVYFEIAEKYALNDSFSLVLEFEDGLTGQTSQRITGVYEGQYSSIAEAESAKVPNILDQITGDGYASDYSNGIWFTVFIGNDEDSEQEIYSFCVRTQREAPSSDSIITFTGLRDTNNNPVTTYVLDSTHDSYAENNYVTFLVMEDVDLSKEYAPVFTIAENASAYTEGNTSPEVSGKSFHSFSNGALQYSVSAENGVNSKNYWVQIKQIKQSEGKLYITSLDDPDANTYEENGITYSTREVMLDSYHRYIHDICLVNVGEKALENLSVELDSDVVELDSYWTLTGQQSLAGMSTVTKPENGSGTAGELPNLAKLRLHPAATAAYGTDVSGTLTIKSDGKPIMVLTLTGTIGDPGITTTEIPEAVKYVPYGSMIQNSNKYSWIEPVYSLLSGELPEGMELKANGELYGVPKKSGRFTFEIMVTYNSVKEDYYFGPSRATFTLDVKENTNANVYNESDADLGYSLEVPVGVETSPGSYDFYLNKIEDTLFVSEGLYHEFIDFWLNGEKLVKGVDYTAESGSTRITISAQTLQNKALQTGTNTIAAEFRVDGDVNKELRRTAQNFRLNIETGGNSSGSGSSGSNSSGSGSSGIDTAEGKTNAVDLAVRLVNTAGSPLSNMTVELHSTPKTALTNQNGVAAFYNVEEGTHTIYVKNMAGTVIASKVFNLNLGSVTQMKGVQLTAIAGSAVTLTIQINEGTGTLSFQSFQKGDPYRVLTARTGDETAVMPWVVTLIVACAAVGTVIILEKKKRNRAA